MFKNTNESFILCSRAGLGDFVKLLPIVYGLKKKYPASKIGVVISGESYRQIAEYSQFFNNIYVVDNRIAQYIFFVFRSFGKYHTGIVDVAADGKKWGRIFRFVGCKNVISASCCSDASCGNEQGLRIEIVEKLDINNYYGCFKMNCKHSTNFKFETVHVPIIGFCFREEFNTYDIHTESGVTCNQDKKIVKFLSVADQINIVESLIDNGYFVLLFGDKITSSVLSQIPDKAVNLIGKTSILDMIDYMKQCQVVIGGDCGPIQLCDLIGIPTVVYYASTNPADVGPFSNNCIKISAGLECQPCFRIKNKTCKELKCLALCPKIEILDAVSLILKDSYYS